MAILLNFPSRQRTVERDISVLLYVPITELDRHLYKLSQQTPEYLPMILAVVRIVADELAPGKRLPPGWDAESMQTRREELISVLALYPCVEGESQERPTA